MEPATSWFLVGFVSTVPRWELHTISFYCGLGFYYIHYKFYEAESFTKVNVTKETGQNKTEEPSPD